MRTLIYICCLFFSPAMHAQGLMMKDTLALRRLPQPGYTPLLPSLRSIPQDQYTKNFGFFCRQELKMQQAHIPVTFRLGNMDYVNQMEGKTHGR